MVLSKEEIKKAFDEDKPLGFLNKIKLVLMHPSEFFRRIQSEKGLKAPLLYYLVFYGFATTVGLLVSYSFNPAPFVNIVSLNLSENVYLSTAIGFIYGVIVILFYTFLTHILSKLLKGHGSYSDTFRAFAYGPTPSFIFGPIISILFTFVLGSVGGVLVLGIALLIIGFWSLWLEYKILGALHRISEWKAFFAIILPVIIIAVAVSAIGVMFIMNNRISDTITSEAQNELENQLLAQGKKIGIMDTTSGAILIRNIGTATINPDEISVYIDGSRNNNCVLSNDLEAGSLGTLPAVCTCAAGQEIKVLAPGSSDTRNCIG